LARDSNRDRTPSGGTTPPAPTGRPSIKDLELPANARLSSGLAGKTLTIVGARPPRPKPVSHDSMRRRPPPAALEPEDRFTVGWGDLVFERPELERLQRSEIERRRREAEEKAGEEKKPASRRPEKE
jgi:hypothetical protein